MRRQILGSIAAAAVLMATTAAAPSDSARRNELFPYPQPPEGLTLLRERCNFLVYHFWDRADMKKVFERPEGLNAAFGDWISFMPYCAADTAHLAINNLLKIVGKDGKKLLRTAEMAENWTYSDTADIVSEELYRPFAAAAATHKKVPADRRAHFSRQLRCINSSSLGQTLPAVAYRTPDGKEAMLEGPFNSTMIVIVDLGDTESTTAGIRFSIDPATRSLVDSAELRIAWFYPGEPTEATAEALAKLPDNWVKGTLPDVDNYFTIRTHPAIYLLDDQNRVILKDRPYQMALQVFNVMAAQK